jgi:hypothetical protein
VIDSGVDDVSYQLTNAEFKDRTYLQSVDPTPFSTDGKVIMDITLYKYGTNSTIYNKNHAGDLLIFLYI